MKQQEGLNLLELLLTLCLASILLGMVLPTLERLIETHQQAAELNRLRGILDYGRQQASLRGDTLQLCPSQQGQTCLTQARPDSGLLLIGSHGERVRFFPGQGHLLAFPDHEVLLRPLPRRGTGATLLPCTGFRQQPPKALTLSATGRVRTNTAPPSTLVRHCRG